MEGKRGKMQEHKFETHSGTIHYWVNRKETDNSHALVFLPGLTADHRLFDRQVEYFNEKCRVLVWDAPGHGASRPFALDFTLEDKAKWLQGILEREGIEKPVLIGQSMGGYVAQMYLELFPASLSGYISIDSAPLKRKYVTAAEIWLLKRMEPVYRMYPWKALIKSGSGGVADMPYGKQLMRDMMVSYEKKEYCALAGLGFRILAEAMEADRPYEIDCPCLLICGEHDRAGSAKNYNKRWAAEEKLPIVWLKNAGHNANTDRPEQVNELIARFCGM